MEAIRSVYYLPGRGGSLQSGLGAALAQRDYEVTGRETTGAFQKLLFSEQVAVIAQDLQESWDHDARIVANSFGAYLFLHAQAMLPPFPGKVLLLSPVVGGVVSQGNGPRFSPPFANRLLELAEAGQLTGPLRCEAHVGDRDWQCPFERVSRLGRLMNVPVHKVAGAGHLLPINYVATVLDRWL